jgi:hypothetical protein
MTQPQSLQDFPDTSQVSLHKNDKINIPTLQEMQKMMPLFSHTHTHTVYII